MIDLCKMQQVSDNPVTFGVTVEATYGPYICNAKIASVGGTNIYKYTVTQFVCAEACSFRLMIIVGKCIKHYFCCGVNWQEVTKMIDNVEGDSYIRVFKFGNQPEPLTFSLTMLIGGMWYFEFAFVVLYTVIFYCILLFEFLPILSVFRVILIRPKRTRLRVWLRPRRPGPMGLKQSEDQSRLL